MTPEARLRAALLLVAILACAPSAARAQDTYETPPSAAYEGVVGFGAAITTLVYAPVKLTYAITGSTVGALAWLVTLGDSEVALGIIRPAVGGDYVVEPRHIEGRDSLRVMGG